MTATRTNIAYQHAYREFKRLNAETHAVMVEEFPIGSRVQWVHTYHSTGEPQRRAGTVVDHSHGAAIIQIKPGGPKHRIAGQHLEFVP